MSFLARGFLAREGLILDTVLVSKHSLKPYCVLEGSNEKIPRSGSNLKAFPCSQSCQPCDGRVFVICSLSFPST